MEDRYDSLGKAGRLWYKDDIQDWLMDLNSFCNNFLNIPRKEYLKLEQMISEYESRRASMEVSAVRYDAGGLGVRIQTTPDNHFEAGMCNLISLEKQIDIQYMQYFTAWMTVKNLINQCDIKDRKRRDYVVKKIRDVLIAYHDPTRQTPSFEQIGDELGINKTLAWRNYVRGQGSLQVAIEEHCFHEV